MQPRIAFCNRCRGMRVGWNRGYILHCFLCKHWFRSSTRLATLATLTAVLVLFPVHGDSFLTPERPGQPIQKAAVQASVMPVDPAVHLMDAFLKQNDVRETNRIRLAESIVNSAIKHNLSPRLIASIMIVESRGNPFAISAKNAIGIMQIHLPTWGQTADREGINLFKIEDNIDLGARILKNYIRQFGLWQGVKRYNGFIADNPTSVQSAEEYVGKVQRVYELRNATSQADLE